MAAPRNERDADLFAGTLFAPTLPQGHEPATATLEGQTLAVAARTQSRRWSLASLRGTRGGAAGRMLFLSTSTAPDESFATSDFGILAHPSLSLHPEITKLRKGEARRRWVLPVSLAAAVVLLTALIAGLGWTIARSIDPVVVDVAQRIPHTWEKRLGDGVMGALSNELALLEAPTREFRELAKPLLDVVSYPIPFELHVAREKTTNAFALPGAHVVFFSGLLLEARSPSEALGVLAHEMAHVTQRHTMRQLVRSTGLIVGLQILLGDVGGLSGAAAHLGQRLLTLSYSRDLEREADTRAVDYLAKAGLGPEGLIAFFERIEAKAAVKPSPTPAGSAETKSTPGPREKGSEDWSHVDRERLAQLSELMSSHPSLASRREALRQKGTGGGTPAAVSGFDWAGFQKRLAEP